MALIKAKTQINFEWNMWIGLQIAALQFIYIPIVIKVLNQAWVDSRYVHGFGLLLVMATAAMVCGLVCICAGNSGEIDSIE